MDEESKRHEDANSNQDHSIKESNEDMLNHSIDLNRTPVHEFDEEEPDEEQQQDVRIHCLCSREKKRRIYKTR